jgi:ferrochelatase
MGKRGVLLVNLGSPDSTRVSDVRRYLHQFLMDERVIESPYLIRKFVVCCLILPFRPKQSAEAYKKIWWKEGSPLVVIGKRVEELLRRSIDLPIGLGMRYGNPSIRAGLADLLARSKEPLDEIFLLPLYPHYAMSSYETVVEEMKRVMLEMEVRANLQVHPPFYDDPDYIAAMVESAREYLESDYDYLLFSYHGLPERHIEQSDPTGSHCLQVEDCCHVPSPAHATCYRAQAFKTTQAFVEKAGIPEGNYSISFQSRLGRDPWLKPYTDFEFERLAKEGVRKLLVICPAFVSDCLETLEEIGIRGREAFLSAGGEDLRLIPCMNDHPAWIRTLAGWCSGSDPASDAFMDCGIGGGRLGSG